MPLDKPLRYKHININSIRQTTHFNYKNTKQLLGKNWETTGSEYKEQIKMSRL